MDPERSILEVLEKGGVESVENLGERAKTTKSQTNSILFNLEKRGRVVKDGKGWKIGNVSVEKKFLEALKTPKKAVDISIEVNESSQYTNKILYSLETSKLAKRTVTNPPIWSLVDEKDELKNKIIGKLDGMSVGELKELLMKL